MSASKGTSRVMVESPRVMAARPPEWQLVAGVLPVQLDDQQPLTRRKGETAAREVGKHLVDDGLVGRRAVCAGLGLVAASVRTGKTR